MSTSNWREYFQYDPFLDIEPSLLSSHHIKQYTDLGCLVSEPEQEKFLPAGYRMYFLGELHSWDWNEESWKLFRDGWNWPRYGSFKHKVQNATKGSEIVLPSNSITYLFMQEGFRLPEYIAARFNLCIKFVHKGLLLGTGPLVDPGFEGQLLVPLHNLTDNDYPLIGGESFIHVEFTKLCRLERWKKQGEGEVFDNYVPFPIKEKVEKLPRDYFDKSGVTAKQGVASSMELTLRESREAAQQAKASIRKFELMAFIGGTVAAAALIIGGFSLVSASNGVIFGAEEAIVASWVHLNKTDEKLQSMKLLDQRESANQARVAADEARETLKLVISAREQALQAAREAEERALRAMQAADSAREYVDALKARSKR